MWHNNQIYNYQYNSQKRENIQLHNVTGLVFENLNHLQFSGLQYNEVFSAISEKPF
jgi:hypothetical protein